LLSTLIGALISLLGHRFIEVWLSSGFSATGTALIVLVWVQLFNLCSGPGLFILWAKGILRPGVYSAIFGVVSNLFLSTVLIIRLGFTGALYGTALSMSAATLLFIIMFHRETGYPFARFWTPYLKPLGCALILVVAIKRLVPISQMQWLGMIVIAVAFALSYGLGLLLLNYFDSFDWRTCKRFLSFSNILRGRSRYS
jgi:O-antigen/teichoic acid export membrane protein